MRKFLPFFWILLGFSTSACLNLLGLQKERTYHLDRIVSHDVTDPFVDDPGRGTGDPGFPAQDLRGNRGDLS